MIRPFVYSFVLAAVAACATLAAPQASARALGSISIDTTGPVTPTPLDPWGGKELCTAHMRKWNQAQNRYDFHMASGYSAATCWTNAGPYLSSGWGHNPNMPGMCVCHPGFNGFMVSSPAGTGPLSVNNLSAEQIQLYDEGLFQLRQKYQFNAFEQEHELLLQAIESLSATPASPAGTGAAATGGH